MRARLPATNMMVFFQAGQDRHFQGVVDKAGPVEGGIQVTADFPRANCPVLPLAAEVALGFHSSYLTETVWAPGQVNFRREEQFRHRYGFLFQGEAEQLVRPVVNCRRSPRVRPDGGAPIDVNVKSTDGRFEVNGILDDVSSTGMSIAVPLQGESKLYQAWHVQLSFRLPSVQQAFQLIGGICYRRLDGNTVHYGVDFNPESSVNFQHQHTLLMGFVNSGLGSQSVDPVTEELRRTA